MRSTLGLRWFLVLFIATCNHQGLRRPSVDASSGGSDGAGAGVPADTGTWVFPPPPSSCADGQRLCRDSGLPICADTSTHPRHCGACGHACATGVPCSDGRCQQIACSRPIAYIPGEAFRASPSNGLNAIVTTADVNGDQVPDLVGYQQGMDATAIHVSLGKTGGGFEPPIEVPLDAASWGLYAFDLNRDGRADLVTLQTVERRLSYWLGQPDGSVRPIPGPEMTSGPLDVLAFGDVNGDGYIDAVTEEWENVGLRVFLSDGRGGLDGGSSRRLAAGSPERAVLADFDADGFSDVACLDLGIDVIFGQRSGGLASASSIPGLPASGVQEPSFNSSAVAFGPLNGDDRMDVIVPSGLVTRNFLLGSDRAFSSTPGFSLRSPAVAWAFVDLDGDSMVDVVSLGADMNVLNLYAEADGSHAADLWTWPKEKKSPYSFVTVLPGDFTRDGRPDLLVITKAGVIVLLESTCVPRESPTGDP